MAHYLLSAEATFAAAHTLPGVKQCERLHGHNWRVRLTVRVEEDGIGPHGMGVDFRVIEDAVKDTVAPFEHQYLNDLRPFAEHPPTAERLARLVCEGARARLDGAAATVSVHEVEVWELPQYRVVYRP
jgi:6-pyruvoyltetrahydropterin/6-carboxytetrahydropterin synthase